MEYLILAGSYGLLLVGATFFGRWLGRKTS